MNNTFFWETKVYRDFVLLLLFSFICVSQFVLIANIFNIGRDGRDGTVRAKVMYF